MTLLILSAVVHLLLNRSKTPHISASTYHEELAKARVTSRCLGTATELEGLVHRVLWREANRHRRPFAETKELIADYTLIQVKSREEAGLGASPIPRAGPFEIRPAEDLTEMIRESEHRRSRAKGE